MSTFDSKSMRTIIERIDKNEKRKLNEQGGFSRPDTYDEVVGQEPNEISPDTFVDRENRAEISDKPDIAHGVDWFHYEDLNAQLKQVYEVVRDFFARYTDDFRHFFMVTTLTNPVADVKNVKKALDTKATYIGDELLDFSKMMPGYQVSADIYRYGNYEYMYMRDFGAEYVFAYIPKTSSHDTEDYDYWYTLDNAVDALGLSRNAILKRIKRGTIPWTTNQQGNVIVNTKGIKRGELTHSSLVSAEEVMNKLNISRDTFRKRLDRGTIQSHTMDDGTVYYDISRYVV